MPLSPAAANTDMITQEDDKNVPRRDRQGRRRRRVTRLVVLLTAMSGLLAALLVGAAGPASASASGCTTASLGDVCFTINGSGDYVNNVYIVRNKASWSGICYYTGTLRAYYGNSSWVVASQSQNGCTYGRAWFTIPVNQSYWPDTLLCGSFYEYGQIQGSACEWVE
jgi:hypothetical protein